MKGRERQWRLKLFRFPSFPFRREKFRYSRLLWPVIQNVERRLMVSIRVFSSSHSLVVAATVFPFQNIGWVIHSAESMKEFLSLVYLSVHVIFIGVATTDFDTHNKKRSKRNSVKTIQHAPHFMLILFPRFFISFRSFFSAYLWWCEVICVKF